MSNSGPTTRGLSQVKQELLRRLMEKEGLRGRRREVIARRTQFSPCALSLGQQRLWFVEQLQPGNAAYNVFAAVRLSGKLSQEALARSLDEVVRRHESLRTTFQVLDGQPVQVIAPDLSLRLPLTDLRHVAQHEQAIAEEARRDAQLPFDLTEGPLVRARLLRLSETEHILLFTLHHIVSDGWSMGVLVREVAALYDAFVTGDESPLEELPIQYADYAAWQREWLTGEVLARQLDYWRTQLAGLKALELPTDRPRPRVLGAQGARVSFRLRPELVAGLRELSRGAGATLFMTLLAGFDLLLARYTGQTDVTVGTPIANRTRAETEGLVGFFVNTLVMRTDVGGDPCFRELLARVRGVALDAYAHQDVPFEKLVEELQPERDLNHTPLFQVSFTYHDAPMLAMSLPGLALSRCELATGVTRFDLELHVWEQADESLSALFSYNTALFDASTIERAARHFNTLLEAAVNRPDLPVAALPLLTEEERRQLLFDWNETATDFPRHSSVHEQFAAQVERTPNAVALVCGQQQLTYAELNRRANQLAHYLQRLGVGAAMPVAICAERSVEMIVGLLGILKAGGCYVPIDPAYPLQRQSFILEDVRAPMLLTVQRLTDRLPAHWGQIIELDADQDAISDESEDAPADATPADSLTYMMYTSGSTGVPKGVSVTHRNVLRLVKNNWFAALNEDETFLQLAPLSFDASTFEIWGALLNGGRLVLMPPHTPTLEEIGAALKEHRITTLWLTAGLFHLLVDRHVGALGGLRQLLAGGDVLSVPHVERVLRELPGCTLINGYGPTESTTFACCYAVPPDGFNSAHTPIGRPIANTQVYLLDERLQPAPVGITGELYIGGDGLARCYHDRPALTAERFIPHPFSTEPGARLYKTGDLARYLNDGQIEFLGRRDEQVKVRGYRVEPGEVEAVLGQHASVGDAVVVARADASGERRLVAYLTATDDAALNASKLRSYLAERLPEHMIPSAFVVLDALPLTPNGKVDRRALPAPEQAQGESAENYVAPRTPLEEVVCGIWAEVLGVARVGITDSFFELGGHSLLATQVVSRIRDAFRLELPLRSIFESPTVAALTEIIAGSLRGEQDGDAPPLVPVGRERALPLSFAQQRLWFMDQLEPDSAHYNIPLALRLRGELRVDVLERALTEIIRRHEVLRTNFGVADGQPVQLIAPPAPFTLEVLDVSCADEQERMSRAMQLAREEAAAPFNLARDRLLRVRLLRLDADDHVVLLTMHHIVSDGWSMGVLVREVSVLYEALLNGAEAQLAELPIQYADYAAWQRAWLTDEVLAAQLGYWRAQLADAPPLLALPTDRARQTLQPFAGGVVRAAFDAQLARQLRALSRREGVTLFMTLLGAFQTLLHRHTGQTDIVLGTPIANRTRHEIENLVGFFVNTLVLRTDLSGNPSFRALLSRVREAALGAYAHQDLPFDRLVEALQPERSLSHTPLIQAVFALQNAPVAEAALPGLTLSRCELPTGVTRFDLELHVWEQADESLHAFFNYNTALFDEQTITRLLARFQLLLQEIVAAPDESLASYRLMTESERQRLLVAYNQDRTAYPRERAIHELFAEQAAAHPAAVAVVFADRQITYGELDGRADKLARYLRARGVGPETRVGLCVERSVEMLVGLLGILKAGGVYVPLDPDYPSERLRFIIADTSARLVLTQRHLAAALPQQSAEVVCLDSDWTPGTTESGAWVPPSVSGDNLAYIIYTSGSTGVPKGVGVAHRSVIRLVRATNYAAFGPGEVCLQFAPLSFDASTFEIWGALLNGGRLVVMPPGANALEEVAQSISRHRITTLWLTAGLFHLLVDRHVAALGGLRQLLAGGDVLSVPHVRKFLRAAPHCTLVNGYGPTENTTFTCCYRMTADTEINNSVPIGRPVSNTEVYVVDGNLEPVAEGIAGELLVGGDGLARGYYNRPELTAERFIPHPFSTEPGARLYRTGDLVRHLPDGHIEFLGRIDQQVKVRGFRIEPGEIEAALLSHKQVRAAAVIAEAENGTGKRLIAYVVAEGDAANGRELRRYLKERLPDYMIPAAFVALAGLPLTPNGKIDRRALPAPAPSGRDEEYVAPRTPVEEVVCGIWAEVLGVARVSIADNFFELGGHSLLATQVVSRVRATFGVDVPLRALFAAGTVSGLSEYVEQSLRARPAEQPPAIKPVSREQNLPLSYAQQRLWFLDQLEPGSAAFNISTAVRFVGQLDIVALERSFNEVVRRHESLRTTFVISGRQPVQLISPPRHLLLPVEDLSHLPESERETTVERLAAEEARRPFDLANDRLLRVRLLRLDADDHVVLLTMHHIISDGWSMGVLVSEVAALYGAFVAGDESPLEELPIQYADYALWQREWLTGEVLARQLDYWRAQLAQVSVLELPTDRPRPPVQSTSGARFNFRLSDTLAESLRALSRAEGATLFMTLLAAFDVLLYRYSGQTEFTVGTPVAGRTRVETEPLIGFFVNTLVLRARVQPEQTFRQLLAEVRRDALGAYAHQDVPFERVVEELQPERDLSRTPLFQTMFVLQNTPQETLALPGLALSSTSGYGGRVNFDLVLNMQDTAEGLQGFLEYNTDLYDAATAARIVGHFQTLLNGVAADPEQRVARLPLLTAAERRQLLEDWDATRAGFKPAECIQQMFTAQAERGPEAVAVRFQGEQLRYGELDARSNQLAHGLREVTETPRRCVAVMLDDARRQVIALLGVLKAGHHFVCLDAEHPVARLQQILAEVKPACLITEAAAIGRHAPWLKQFADESGVRLVSMDASDRFEAVIDGARWFTDCPAADPRIRVRSDDIAYIVYTSGSTGRPKGIVQTHGSFCQFAGWMSARFEMGPGQCIAQWAAITYDAAYAEIFSALASGATLCMATPSVKAEPQAVVEWLRDERVTLFQTVPSFAAQVLGVIEQLAARIDEEPLPHLEHVLLAGEVLPAKLARAWLALYPRRPVLYNLYGPTESILATYQVVDAACAGQASVPVGRAIDGRQILILDAAQQPCPVGVPGEIYIRSPYLTAGYFKRPQETQRRFLQNPLHDEYPDAVFRTGDLGRWRTDGSVEFFGRLDNQVKVRGMRLELEELEAALARHERVTECAVALVAFGENDQRLVAYVVTAGDVSAQALRSSLETAVPAGLLPAHFVFLERLPRTASGKIARAELPPPDAQQADENGNAYLAPRTPLEASIAAVWREFLAVERVGVGDNFFHLGGHSLLATQVINRLRQQHAIELPLRAFMESPTVAGLARSIEGAQRAPAPAAAHLASLLEQVKSLSDEEVRALLSQRQSSAPQDLS